VQLFRPIPRLQVEHSTMERQVISGWNHIDHVRGYAGALLRMADVHRRVPAEKIGQDARAMRRQMLDDDEDQTTIRWHGVKELAQGVEPTGRGTDANDGHRGTACGRLFFHSSLGYNTALRLLLCFGRRSLLAVHRQSIVLRISFSHSNLPLQPGLVANWNIATI
jgi:hypothetical protein